MLTPFQGASSSTPERSTLNVQWRLWGTSNTCEHIDQRTCRSVIGRNPEKKLDAQGIEPWTLYKFALCAELLQSIRATTALRTHTDGLSL